ncbi:MAG TPA: response regulator [Candidatus Obscuribacterales bacterium]
MARPMEVLLVEDSLADIRIAQEALQDAGIAANLHIVMDGEAAVRFLTRKAPYTAARTPDIVLLDLNIPRMDGHQVLDELRQVRCSQDFPIVLLTASDNVHDVEEAQKKGMNYYLRKPIEGRTLGALLTVVKDLWH